MVFFKQGKATGSMRSAGKNLFLHCTAEGRNPNSNLRDCKSKQKLMKTNLLKSIHYKSNPKLMEVIGKMHTKVILFIDLPKKLYINICLYNVHYYTYKPTFMHNTCLYIQAHI